MSTFILKFFLPAFIGTGSGSVSWGLAVLRGALWHTWGLKVIRGISGPVDASSLSSRATPNFFSRYSTSLFFPALRSMRSCLRNPWFPLEKGAQFIYCIPVHWPRLASGHSKCWSKLFKLKIESPVENDDQECDLVSDKLGLNSGLITDCLNNLVP